VQEDRIVTLGLQYDLIAQVNLSYSETHDTHNSRTKDVRSEREDERGRKGSRNARSRLRPWS
jgi:hypothetical protein